MPGFNDNEIDYVHTYTPGAFVLIGCSKAEKKKKKKKMKIAKKSVRWTRISILLITCTVEHD